MENGDRTPMSKRATRRHHEERVKSKFKQVAKRLAGKEDTWVGKWDIKWENGKIVSRRHYIDRTGAVKRMQFIEKTAVKMAHHPRHQCQMCRLGPKEAKRKHDFELARKSPEIDDE
jgi:pterin-4a-carbinolamine dehydratase